MFIATLIAAGKLSGDDISAAQDRLDAAGCLPAAHVWLDEGFAADIMFGLEPEAARTALEGVFPDTDVVVQLAEGREKKLLVADMDLDHDHRRMHRRTGRLCRDQAADRSSHRSRDARRARLRIRAGCTRGAAQGLGRRRHRAVPCRACDDHARRRLADPHDEGARRDDHPGVGRLHPLRRAGRGDDRLRPRHRQPAGDRRTARYRAR